MKLIKPLTCALAIGMSGMAFADVTVKVPEDVTILVANGEKVELSGGFFASEKTFTLPDGVNQVVFRYAPYFSKGNERQNIEGDAIITRFEASNSELTFQLPQYRDARDAQKNIKNLDWKLVDNSGQAITVAQDKLIKLGMQLGRDYVREVEDYNEAGGVAAVMMTSVAVPAAVPAAVSNTTGVEAQSVKADTTAEEMLHFWYQKADADTKARFKAYINQQ